MATKALPKTVIVTGAAGFVGIYVCKALLDNGQVPIALDIEPLSDEALFVLGDAAKTVKFIQCDITDAASVEAACKVQPADAIIHVAGRVGFDVSMRDPARTYAVNVTGTVNILEAARKLGIKKVVLVSSYVVYQRKQYEPFDEQHPVTSIAHGNPNTHYGTSKAAAEQIGLAYATFHGLDVTAARITSVYGFGMKDVMVTKRLIEGAVQGQRVALPTGAAMPRDYTYIKDTVAGIMGLLNADTAGFEQRIYNVTRGELLTAAEVFAIGRKIFPDADLTIGTDLTPLEAANIAQRAPLTSEAAKRSFGFQPRYSMEQGLREYADMMRRFLNSKGSPDGAKP